jgi:dethiobiotin synthetase
MNSLLITGTDPQIGQSQLTQVLTAYWQTYHPHQSLGLLSLQPPIDLHRTWQQLKQLNQDKDWVLVSEYQGLGSLVARETTIADLAWDWRLPTILVVPVRLGAIGQAVAHAALARQARCQLQGMVLCCLESGAMEFVDPWATPNLIQQLTRIPVLGVMPDFTHNFPQLGTHSRIGGFPESLDDREKLTHIATGLDLEILPIPTLTQYSTD